MDVEERVRYEEYDDLDAANSFDVMQLSAHDWPKIKHVRAGILLLLIDKVVHAAIGVLCLVLLLAFHSMFLEHVGNNNEQTAMGLLVGVGMAFLCFAGCPLFLSGCLAIVGNALCTDVPPVTGARRPMIVAIVCYALFSFAGKFAGQIHPAMNFDMPLASLLVLIMIPLWLAAYTAFTIFLIRLARFFKAEHLPRRITMVTCVQAVSLGILFVSVGADGLRKINAETLYSLLIGASIFYLTWTLMSVWVYSGYYKRLGNLPFPTR